MNTKGPTSPSSQGSSYILSLLMLLVILLSLTLALMFPLNMLFKPYSIIEFPNLGPTPISRH